MSKTTSLAPETLAAQALHYIDLQTGAIIPPIQPSPTFVRDENNEFTGRIEKVTVELT